MQVIIRSCPSTSGPRGKEWWGIKGKGQEFETTCTARTEIPIKQLIDTQMMANYRGLVRVNSSTRHSSGLIALKLGHEEAEMMTNEEPLKQNYHSENKKNEIDSDSNISD